MSIKIDTDQGIPSGKKPSAQERKNARIRSKGKKSVDTTTKDLGTKTITQTNKEKIDTDSAPLLLDEVASQEQETVISNEKSLVPENTKITHKENSLTPEDTTIKISKPSRESLRDRQLANRSKRRERHQKRKQELLQSALKKLKSHDQSGNESLNALEQSLANKASSEPTESGITTGISEKEILDNAVQPEAVKSEPPKAQSAKDRFKNALKKITTALNEEVKPENNTQSTTESAEELAFKKKLHDRNRVKKIVTEYLERTGLTYTQGNFQILCNDWTDKILQNLDAVPPKNKRRVESLRKRAESPIRSGNNVLDLHAKKTKPSQIVGDLFSRYDIDAKKDKIILNTSDSSTNIRFPKDNFDTLLEDLINNTLLDMSDIKHIDYDEMPNKNIMNMVVASKDKQEFKAEHTSSSDNQTATALNTQQQPPVPILSSPPIMQQAHSQRPQRVLKEMLGDITHTQNKLNAITDLKSKLNKLIS